MNLNEYSKIVVAFSGGKDSLACLLHLLDLGVESDRLELCHHNVDGSSSNFMDWICTPAYCQAIARAFGIPIYFSWKEGGFEREMLRDNQPTAPTWFETPERLMSAGGNGKPNTRLKFPQVSADLSVRWCSAYLKIDVASIALRHQERFNHTSTLFVTGERAQESPARSRYRTFEPHRADNRSGRCRRRFASRPSHRHIDHWRPVHAWDEAQVWEIVRKYRVNPRVAYRLGWGRVSCQTCIFGSADQWASVRALAPDKFAKIAQYEVKFGTTINRNYSITELADRGTPYPETANKALVAEANDEYWNYPAIVNNWQLPSGAFGEPTGPT